MAFSNPETFSGLGVVLDFGNPSTFDPVFHDTDIHSLALVCKSHQVQSIRIVRVCGRPLLEMVVEIFEPHGYSIPTDIPIEQLPPQSKALATILALGCYLILVVVMGLASYILRGLVIGFTAPAKPALDFMAIAVGISVTVGIVGLTQFVDAMAGSYYR